MRFKYTVISIVLSLLQIQNSFAQEAPAFDVEQLVRSIESRGVDSTTAEGLVNKAQQNNVNKYAVENIGKNPVKLKLQEDTGDIANDKGIDIGKLVSKYNPELKAGIEDSKKLNRLLIFISLSMPKESLVQLNEQAKKAGGLLILRGLVNNSFKETASVLHGLSQQGINVVIDPRLFDVFLVTAVPTFVVTPTDTNPCAGKECNFTPEHDRTCGNITLEYALERIAKEGKVSNEVAAKYLEKLRGQP